MTVTPIQELRRRPAGRLKAHSTGAATSSCWRPGGKRSWRLPWRRSAAGLAVFALNRLGGPEYKAWADVAIVRTVSELTLDPRFTTTSDTDVRYIASNATAFRNALLGLAQGPAIAEQVVAQLGDLLNPTKRIPAVLAETSLPPWSVAGALGIVI